MKITRLGNSKRVRKTDRIKIELSDGQQYTLEESYNQLHIHAHSMSSLAVFPKVCNEIAISYNPED